MFELDQYLDMFLDESREHLESLNQNLLELENNPDSKDIVNEIFRIAHTLKGMSSTMGFERIAKLTHRMENILDEIRADNLQINTSIIDVMFKGLDRLEEFIKSIENDGKEIDKDIEDIVAELENLGNENAEEEASQSQESENLASEAVSSGSFDEEISNIKNIEYIDNIVLAAEADSLKSYSVKVVVQENCMLKSARAFLVFRAIEEHGEIIYSNPTVEDIEDEKFEDGFFLICVNSMEMEELKESISSISEIKEVIVENYEPKKLDASEIVEEPEVEELVIEEKKEEVKPVEIKETKESQDGEKDSKKQDQKSKKGKIGKTVRVDIDRLDNLMNLVSELIIVKTRLEDQDISKNMHNMNEAIEYLERITTSLHDAVTKVRMVPIERVFNRFPRMIRDLSRDLNKEINLIMSGEETEVDRTVIDEIGEPLIHLLRNSIDHGIEVPEIRKQLNKPEVGTVKLLAYPDGNNVVIEVCDDGSGLNLDKIKEKALSRGVINKEKAEMLDDKDIAELIFAPGFSTADTVSNISGRGVGLDVVKTKIESLGGTVEIETEKNKGSKFIIRLPLTLAIIQALLVIVGEEKYAIPLNNIKEITNINKSDVRLVEGKEIVLYRGKTLPLVNLGEVLNTENFDTDEELIVVIVKKGEKDLGVIVNNLIGQQEIVIKSLGKYLSGINFIAGATILGNGSVALIIDTNSLF